MATAIMEPGEKACCGSRDNQRRICSLPFNDLVRFYLVGRQAYLYPGVFIMFEELGQFFYIGIIKVEADSDFPEAVQEPFHHIMKVYEELAVPISWRR